MGVHFKSLFCSLINYNLVSIYHDEYKTIKIKLLLLPELEINSGCSPVGLREHGVLLNKSLELPGVVDHVQVPEILCPGHHEVRLVVLGGFLGNNIR